MRPQRIGKKHMRRQYRINNSCRYQGLTIVFCVVFLFLCLRPSHSQAQNMETGNRPIAEVFEIIEKFVREDYLSSWFASPRLIRRHFSDPLDYYWGKKDVPLKEVVRDKMAYVTRWPQRYYRLLSESLEVTRSELNPYIYAVRFNYEFETRRRGDERAGMGETILLIELFDKRVMIRGEGGKVLQRY
jgi:hypothetical protein